MTNHVWKPICRPHLGMTNSISEMIRNEEWRSPGLLTNVRKSPTLIVASDYSGEHPSAAYLTISVLLADLQGLVSSWEPQRRMVRSKFAGDGRRLSYKKLGDRQRARMLTPFLGAADHIPGIVATFLIDRRIKSFFDQGADPASDLVVDRRTWKPRAFEKLLRVAHFGSLLIAGLSAERQNVLWFTDHDAIAANLTKHTEATKVIGSVLSGYLSHPLGHVRVATAQSDDGSLNIEDLLAIPDISAGAWGEVSSNLSKRLGQVAHDAHVLASKNLLPKAHDILLWHSDNRHALKRVAFVVEHVPPKQFKAHMIHTLAEPSNLLAKAYPWF